MLHFQKASRILENLIQVEVLKSISGHCQIKTCLSLKRNAILQIPRSVFRRPCALSIGFKIKPLSQSIFLCYDKNQLKF